MEQTGPAEYMAECLWPGVNTSQLIDADTRATASASATEVEGEQVHYLGSILVPEDEVVFFFFAAASRAAVEQVASRAQIPFERVLRSVRLSNLRITRGGICGHTE